MIEDEITEFKREYADNIKKEVVAFLNTDGGRIYIGIDNKGITVGVTDMDKTILQISNSLRDNIKPDCTQFVKVKPSQKDGKQVIEITVMVGNKRPYYLADKGLRSSGVYIRVGNGIIQATEEYIRGMIKLSDNDRFDEGISLNQSLTFDYASRVFTDKGIDFKQTTLGIIRPDGMYTNLGLLLSDQCGHSIKAAVFQGLTKDVFVDAKEFGGSLLKQLDEVILYIGRFNKVGGNFRGIERVDHKDYPDIAIREAVLNAIVHRDYSSSGNIFVNIYEDRMEVSSLGGLYGKMTKELMLRGVSEPRNAKLANVFHRLKLIEAYGTGIQRIMNSYAGTKLPPQIDVLDTAVVILLKNLNYQNILPLLEPTIMRETSNLSVIEQVILDKFTNKEFTKNDVAEFLNYNPNGAYKLLEKMVDRSLLTAERKGKYIVYRAVEKIEQLVNSFDIEGENKKTLTRILSAMSEAVISIELEDIKSFLKRYKKVKVTLGESKGKNMALKAFKQAADKIDFTNVTGLMLYMETPYNFELKELGNSIKEFEKHYVNKDCNIIFACNADSESEDEYRVTIIAGAI